MNLYKIEGKKKMLWIVRKKQGQSTIEYIILLTLVVLALCVMQKYIGRAMYGRWKTTGDVIGFGMQYDPFLTFECSFDYKYSQEWYNSECYDKNNCYKDCFSIIHGGEELCEQCIGSCIVPECEG